MESEKEEDEDEKVVDARNLYVLMHDEYRVSRNARAHWFFQTINHTVRCNPVLWDNPEELQVLCAQGPPDVLTEHDQTRYRVTPATCALFLAKTYRFVFVLDMSPSITAIDLSSSSVLYEEVFVKLQKVLKSLVKPFRLSGCCVEFLPKIYITVIAHTSLINCKANQVLLQGCLLTSDNMEATLELLKRDLDLFESSMATSLGETLDMDYYEAEDEQKITWGLFEDVERPVSPDPAMNIMTPDASFVNLLRYGILSLQLLPENSTAGIIVITDAVVGIPDHSLFESLMTQLRHTTVSCSFIQLGSGYQLQSGLGHVPYPGLLEFIAAATMGSYFTSLPDSDTEEDGMNVIQKTLLTQSFQKFKKLTENISSFLSTPENNEWTHPTQSTEEKLLSTLHVRKHRDKNLHIPISSLISCRLREGYFIKDISITKGDTQIEVRMTLPWRNDVYVRYLAVSTWPLNNNKRHTHIEVSVEGSYDFLRDMTTHLKQKPTKSPSLRCGLVKRYWQNLQVMSETDELLVHLQSFATNSVYYKVPDSLRQGIPLFYLPPNQSSPHINTQLSNKDNSLSQFATFWKPVLMLDINIWQKWMHTHRLGFILEHDVPLGKHLHIPNSSGRFHNVSCRQAASALNFFLRDYSTFVLMENHSYVTLLSREADKPPWSFFVIRVNSKPPCMVLRLAFVGGTPGNERNAIINDLKEKLTYLRRHPAKDDKGKISLQRRGSRPDLEKKHVPPLQRLSSEIPCCVLTSKPIEKILIRYERMPHDFSTINLSPVMEHSGHMTPLTANKMAFNIYTTLSRYLFHRRWVWSVQHGSSMPVSMQAIGRILSNLTRIRLQEGFNVAHTYSGIVNLAIELEMQKPVQDEEVCSEEDDIIYPCVIQYVIFPPHTTTSKGSVSEEDPEEMETTEADGELQIITECWVEPQWGSVVNSTPEASHYDGLTYKEVAQTIFPTDLDCISTMITFEHLNLMCQSLSVPSPALLGTTALPNLALVEEDYLSSMSSDISIQAVPFPFDLLRLLPKCQQVELLFSTYIQELKPNGSADRSRSATLTQKVKDNQSTEGLRPEDLNADNRPPIPELPPEPKPICPNELLFSLFLESLSSVHDREIHLTDVECEHLVTLIHQRDRDDDCYPFPFVPKQNRLVTEEDIQRAQDGKEFQRSESVLSMATSFSLGSAAAQSHATFSTIASQSQTAGSQSGGLHRLVSTTSTQPRVVSPIGRDMDTDSVRAVPSESATNRHGHDVSMEEVNPRSVARWRCFVRSLTSTHMMLCFAPASFKDLMMLVGPDSKVTDPGARGSFSSKRSSMGGASHPMSPAESKSLRSVSEPQSPQIVDSEPSLSREVLEKTTAESPDKMIHTDDNEITTKPVSSILKSQSFDDVEAQNQAPSGKTQSEPEEAPKPALEAQDSADIPTPTGEDHGGFCPCPEVQAEETAIRLPVYIYNCPLSFLSEQLVNKWTFHAPDDIYEDLTFPADDQQGTSPNADMNRHREAEGTSRTRKISELDLGKRTGQPEDVYQNAKELKQHCTMVSETYLRCFVKGLYQCLQLGCHIHCRDIDSAINEICEESLPLEIDISQFLQCSCGHVRQLIEKANLERMLREDWSKTIPKMMAKGGEEDGTDDTIHSDSLTHPEDDKYNIQIPIEVPISLLQDASNCEASPTLHQLIRHQFEKIVQHNFKPVATHTDFYFFCPPPPQSDQYLPEMSRDIVHTDSQDPDRERKTTMSGDSVVMYEDFPNPRDLEEDDEVVSTQSNKDSISTMSQLVDDELDELDEAEVEMSIDARPLFVNLACSVRVRNGPLRSVPIKNIPVCFNEIQECLCDLDSTIDLNSVRVTLDVICLTLPPEEDLAENFNRPCYLRMTSHTSQISYNSGSAGDDNADFDESLSVTTDISVMQRSMGADPLAHLPILQKEAVTACKEQILWLLRDEITSIMRCIVPVTMDTLEMVTNHIRNSDDKAICSTRDVALKFVGGAEQSLGLFIEDFERMNIPGFHLNREGSYYYLSVDRTYGYNQAHAEALQNALSHLDYVGISADLKEMLLPIIKPEQEAECIEVLSPDAGLEVITEQRSPAHVTEVKGQEAESTEHVPGEAVPPTTLNEREMFRAEDIKISVTRPSPVKELPKGDLERKEDEADEKGFQSDKSSGSSIQVLDDKPEAEHEGTEMDTKPTAESSTTEPAAEPTTPADSSGVVIKGTEEVPDKKPDVVPEPYIRTRNLSGQSSRHSSGGKSQDGLMMSSPSQVLDRSMSRDDGALSSGSQPGRGLSPLTIMGMDVERKSIRRVHSSASFEKYKHEKGKFSVKSNPQTPTLSGWSTPQRRPSGSHTPSRSRHHSGLQTPMSTIETSSRSSVGDDAGYDGDSSDLDEDGPMMSFNETQTLRKPVLPDFWLVMKINSDRVCVFFHTRDIGEVENDSIVCYKSLYNDMVTKIIKTCRIVNQKMLLDVLYNTRMCDKLLVPEADEEVQWGKDSLPRGNRKHRNNEGNIYSDESDTEAQEKTYFDAARDTDPGHFACDRVWQTSFVLHPRLKTGPGRGGMSRGIQTLRSAVLNKFSINNRKNMFVIKESSTKAVFYLRLEETPGDVVPLSTSEGQKCDDLSVSRSSSIMSLNVRKTAEAEEDLPVFASPRGSVAYEKGNEPRITGQEKRPQLHRQRSEDIITLSAHGIGPVGPEISKDLVELLQKKIDDAVLKVLTEILARNPMCKLTPEDVQFVQKPNSPPQKVLALTIPSSAMLQQFALSYYLRQNLQQFVHTPKYMDSKQEGVFLDYTQDPPIPMAEDCVFLYNRPQQSGGNGIACLFLSFVDCKGHPIQLITSPKPSSDAYKDYIDSSTFESMVHTSLYELQKKTPTKAPGPMAVVQFTIWTRGTVDMDTLAEQIQMAMKHSVADVITEYRLLTAPVCEPPQHYFKGLDTPTYSAPPSPLLGHGIDSRHSVSSSDIKKHLSEGGEKTPKEKQTFSLQAIMSDIFHKGGKDNAKDEPEDSQPTWQELEAERRKRQDLREKIQKYESGERGSLLPIYVNTLTNWFHFCHQLKVPTVTKQQLMVSSRFPLDYILKDIAAAINGISQDIIARTFKQVDGCENEPLFLPYSTARSPVGSRDKSLESSLDNIACLHTRSHNIPGTCTRYVMIGRNMKQWRASIDYVNVGEEVLNELHPPLTNPKTHKSYQKYRPLEPSGNSDRPEASGVSSVDRYDRAFIPRQRLLMVLVEDKKLTLFMYNWATELCTNLERQLMRLVQWHNARSQVLLGILCQKMGLFRHNYLRGVGLGDIANNYSEPNPFSQNYHEMDLVKYTQPPSQPSQLKGHASGQALSTPTVLLNEVYRDVKPNNPMHKSKYATLRDPVHRHGAQLLEHSNFVKKENEKRMSLQKLYIDWQQRMTISNLQIPEDTLLLLKQSSRVIHSVATPFMFSPQWRKKILGKHDLPKKPDPHTDLKLPRSRHSSGASIKSRRSGSFDGRWRSQSSMDSPDISSRPYQEEAWHQELRGSFLNQYSQYLQNLGIMPVKTRTSASYKNFGPGGRNSNSQHSQLTLHHCFMQKTLPGGIMLVEIGYSQEYFSINVYGFEVTSLPVSKDINPHLAVMFMDECEKFKDMTHAHSFSHDFHLRMILRYIHGNYQGTFNKACYNVTNFLQDFVQQYAYAPNYTQNYIYENCLVIRNTNSPGRQLFDYMLQHAKVNNMKKIKMLALGEDLEMEEYALVSMVEHPSPISQPEDPPAKVCPQDYSLALVIAHDRPSTAIDLDSCLRLRYWVVLVNDKNVFPEARVERRLNKSKVDTFSADPSSYRCKSRGDSVASHSSVDLAPEATEHREADPDRGSPPIENLNYMGYSNAHQLPIHDLLVKEAQSGRQTILQMVNKTMTHCRRDLLWQRMLLGEMDEGEGRRKRHKTGEHLEPRGQFMTKLTFHEFKEMINMVKMVKISDIDSQLKPIESMPLPWYQGLGKILTQKYAQSLRFFGSPDSIEQHFVVVNPRDLDMLMMLSVDMLGDHSELCFVYKEQEASMEEVGSDESTRLVALELFENFINTCCYHMWTGLL